MVSSYISNAVQINFDSVLGIQDNYGMVNMFRALESTGLRGFLGCPSMLYEQELEQFFDTALIQDGVVTCDVSGKYVKISVSRFAGVFNLPTDGLIDLSEVPNDLVLQARTLFSHSGKHVQFSCKKRLMKYELRLLNGILEKSITVKADSFDAVTHEIFLMMTAIHFGVKFNWSEILFEVLKEMVDRTTRRAKGFAAQICVLLKGDLAVTLGEAKTFPPLKIISEKTSDVAAVAIVKKKSVSKKQPATVSEAPVATKKRTSSGKAVSKEKDLAIVLVALDAEPIQTVDSTSVMPVANPPAPKRRAPKRKLRITADSDDEFIEKESAVEIAVVVQKAPTSADDVDTIIEEVITTTAQMNQADFVESAIAEGIEMETVLADPVLREKVIDEVDIFFNSFSFKKLANLKIEEIYAKEELVLSWAEADSTRCVVPENSNAIIEVVTTGFERLPPICDGLTGSEDHGPIISPVDTSCGYRG
ncbi:hypothetical protein F511_07534 [Dorcoceras hygrometricum]|uniref:Dystroglycan-like n=1 Tax=Dorcoceras hygrometricum TaxID=472368 RepID=A0A2Z7BAZ4_9LAMI|nr:hypothetical protein F511_07534 [Dorcoceras hygrometricum]